MIPEISDVIVVDRGLITFRHPSGNGAYIRDAKTSCGHNRIYILGWKSDDVYRIEYVGQKIHCADCGLIQSYGSATPGKRRRKMERTHVVNRMMLNNEIRIPGMTDISDYDDEPYGGGV